MSKTKSMLADDYIKAAADEMAKDIDFEVMVSLLCESGWTKVVLNPMTFEQSCEIDDWVETHCKGNVDTRGLVWIFKDSKDANWFKLRWQ